MMTRSTQCAAARPATILAAFRAACMAAAALAALAPAGALEAFPRFATETGQQCDACHVMDNSGQVTGLTQYGVGYKQRLSPGWTGPQPSPYAPAPSSGGREIALGYAGVCLADADFLKIRRHGNPNDVIRFKLAFLQNLTVLVPPGSTYARKCGGFPGDDASWQSAG
jgi:hypothetical protein